MTVKIQPWNPDRVNTCDGCGDKRRDFSVLSAPVGTLTHLVLCPACIAQVHRLTAPPGDRGEVVAFAVYCDGDRLPSAVYLHQNKAGDHVRALRKGTARVVPLVAGPSEARPVSTTPSAVVIDAVTARVLAAGGIVGQAAEDAVANVVANALESWGETVLADSRGEIGTAGLAAIGGGR